MRIRIFYHGSSRDYSGAVTTDMIKGIPRLRVYNGDAIIADYPYQDCAFEVMPEYGNPVDFPKNEP